MDIIRASNSLNTSYPTAAERKTLDRASQSAAPAQENESTQKTQAEILKPTVKSESVSEGKVTYSADGDSSEISNFGAEKSAAAQKAVQSPDVQIKSEKPADTQIISETGDITQSDNSEQSSNDANATTEAKKLLLQGYSDSDIKNETGVSQQQIDKIRASMDEQNSPVE